MATSSLNKPQSAYWLWLSDNRSRIEGMVGGRKGSDVAKKGGEMWKALSASARQPYEKKATEKKEIYDKFIATEEGQKALAVKKAAKAEKAQKAEAKTEKADKKKIRLALRLARKKKDNALKKPCSPYWLWLCHNRQGIVAVVGRKPTDVAKKGGEMWKALSESARQPWEIKAKEQKETYEKYIASPKGAAALKAFKEATRAAMDQSKPQGVPTAEQEAAPKGKREEKVENAGNRMKEAKTETSHRRKIKIALRLARKKKHDALKKPSSPYWLWLGHNRQSIVAMVGNKPPDVAKKGGEMWKALSESARQPWEKKAKEQKEAYGKYIASPEGAAALKAFKEATREAKGQSNPTEVSAAEQEATPMCKTGEKVGTARRRMKEGRTEKAHRRKIKIALRLVRKRKDDALKKPSSPYWLWLCHNRQSIVAMVGSKPSDVARQGGVMWKALSESARQPWEKKAREQKEAYDKHIASPEGAAALKAFKEATRVAKDQFKAEVPAAVQEPSRERNAKEKTLKHEPARKRKAKEKIVKQGSGRKRKAEEKVDTTSKKTKTAKLSSDDAAVMRKIKSIGFTRQFGALSEMPELQGLPLREYLEALTSSRGSVPRAAQMLLGHA